MHRHVFRECRINRGGFVRYRTIVNIFYIFKDYTYIAELAYNTILDGICEVVLKGFRNILFNIIKHL